MADTFTTNIQLTNQTVGGNENTWGDIADANFEEIDDVFGDQHDLSTTGGDTPLTTATQNVAIIEVTGTLVSNSTITFLDRGGFWIVYNNTSGAFSVTCRVGTETGVEIPQGSRSFIYKDATDNDMKLVAEITVTPEATVASAATTDILTEESEFIDISGTATITSLGTGINKKKFVRATGAFTLTHNATSLILPTSANIVAESGDTFLVISDASSNARIHYYQRATGQPVSAAHSWETGDPKWLLQSGAKGGWVIMNGTTIGSAASGALQRANADTVSLYTYLWDNLSDNVCAVTTGRGASAAADFAANKSMAMPDMRGLGPIGRDSMGSTAAGILTDATVTGGDGDSDTAGGTGGSEDTTLTNTELPAHTHTGTTDGHVHTGSVSAAKESASIGADGGGVFSADNQSNSLSIDSATDTFTSDSTGSGAAFVTISPFMVGTWYQKL